MLDKPLRERIKRLAAILRVADGFDRGHIGAVADVKVRWMRARAPHYAGADARPTIAAAGVWGASRKSQLLAEVAGVPVEIVGAGRLGDVLRRRRSAAAD